MHFAVTLTVRFGRPLQIQDEAGSVTGCVVVLGANADNFAEAAAAAHEAAVSKLRGTADGQDCPPDVIERAEIQAVELAEWAPDARERFGDVTRKGVYYTSGLVYFSDADDAPRNPWWRFWRR